MKIINCPDCKFYYAPVCTFYKWLPMVSRKGFCYHAVEGKYEGDTPVIKEEDMKDCMCEKCCEAHKVNCCRECDMMKTCLWICSRVKWHKDANCKAKGDKDDSNN